MRIIFGVDNIWGGYLGSVNGSRHRCSHLHSRRPVAVLSLRGRRSRSDVSISSHCNLHKGGSCGCLGVAGASASFETGSLGFNEPILFGLIHSLLPLRLKQAFVSLYLTLVWTKFSCSQVMLASAPGRLFACIPSHITGECTVCTENPEPHVNMTALEAVMEAGIGQETDTSGSRCTAERNHSCCQCVRPSFSIYVKYAEGCNPICICKTLSGS